MKVIILSAGQGKRLLPLTVDRPKCTLPVGERSVLEWQLQALAHDGATDVVVVTGFHADAVRDVVSAIEAPAARTTHNPFYASSDNLGTCWIARHEMTEPFVLINGDTLFAPGVFARLLDADERFPINVVTNEKTAYDDDDMKVVVDRGRLVRVGKTLPVETVTAESIGMVRFDRVGAELFRRRVDELMLDERTLGRWYLSAIDELASEGHVGAVSATGFGWCEVDDQADLEHASATVPGWWIKQSTPRERSA